jgi:hypothetical protein
MSLTRRWCAVGTVLVGSLLGCPQRREDRVRPVDDKAAYFPVWERIIDAAPVGVDLMDLWVRADGAEAWAVGSRNTLLHHMNGKWHRDTLDSSPETQWNSVAFNETGTVGLMVGSGGQMARYAGQHHWVVLPLASSDSFTSVWLDRGGLQGYVVGRGGVILQFADGRWSAVHLDSPPPSGEFTDVVANDREVWVRERKHLTVYSRPELKKVRELDGFGALALWQQPKSGAVWVFGMQGVWNGHDWVVKDSSKYTVRRYDGERSDDVASSSHGAWAVWMAPALSCGIGAGGIPAGGDTNWNLSMYFTPARTVFFEKPDSGSIKSVWVNDTCTAGWGVGSGGFVGRWHLDSWKVGPLTWPEGDIEKLEGHFNLAVDTAQGNATLDSMRLVGEKYSLKFGSLEYFSASRTAGGLDFMLTPAARSLAKKTLQGEEVRLRLYLTIKTPADTFRVAYEKENPFVFQQLSLSERTPGWLKVVLGTFLMLVLVVVALRWAFAREIVLSLAGEDTMGGVPYRSVKVLFRRIDWVRRRLFRTYVNEAAQVYSTSSYTPPELDVSGCEWLARANIQARGRDGLVQIHAHILKQMPRPVLWIEDKDGTVGSELLKYWVGVARKQKGIPVFVELSKPGTIKEKITAAWEEYGDLQAETTAVIEVRGFVLLLDGTGVDINAGETPEFIEKYRRRNLIVICSPTIPTVQSVCHIRVNP